MATKLNQQITERLKELKDQKNWSWEKLAYSAGVSKSAVCQIKNEQNAPSISTLAKLCSALEILIPESFNFVIDVDEL